MSLSLYNTLTRQKEEFKPQDEKTVSFYHCGPTVYWTQHIGNMRGMTCGDIVRRTLAYNGYDVNHVRNYTDVGHLVGDNVGNADAGVDRMEQGSKREGLSPLEIAAKYITEFEADTAKLNILPPTHSPCATKHIADMQDMVKTLVEKGFAYVTKLAIYFDISQAEDYTRLSKQNLDKNISGAGKGDVGDPEKKHPHDFAIWFFKTGAHEHALQTWDFPGYGEGFPGWHIECSAMSKTYLGPTLDIHMGGIEHIPVHHTNEIAQSEHANGVPYVHYWLHNEHLLVDNGKMSKSIGTSFTVTDIENKGFDPLVLRYFFLQAHYRSQQNFTWEALEAAQTGYERLKTNTLKLKSAQKLQVTSYKLQEKFKEKLNNDFDTPGALAFVWESINNNTIDYDTIIDFDRVLGLDLDNVQEEQVEISADVQTLLDQRAHARAEKNWAESDRLRDEIASMGFMVEDTSDGQNVSPK